MADIFDNSVYERKRPAFRHQMYTDAHSDTRIVNGRKLRIAIQPPREWWEERLREWNQGVEGWRGNAESVSGGKNGS